MFQISKPLFLICETPLHAGSGDSLGIVDLPIQREKHTSFPKIEASSLKGALREAFEEESERVPEKSKINKNKILKAFGPEETSGDGSSAGSLGFTDARLLLFPVKSMKGIFALITCYKVLSRFSDDLVLSKMEGISNIVNIEEGKAYPLGQQKLEFGNHFVLEEYTFKKEEGNNLTIQGQNLADWLANHLFEKGTFWHDKVKNDILVLSNDDFKDFVNLSTEVSTRIKINPETGTVEKGALFTEEYLPAESILYSLVLASPEFINTKEKDEGKSRNNDAESIMSFFSNNVPNVIQLGGNATLGKGLLKTKMI